jgi:hypothetical protein
MEATIEFEDSRVNFFLRPTESERKSTYGEKMATEMQFSIVAPANVDFSEMHCDHLALIVLLACHPFSVGDLNIPLNVSKNFYNACKIFTRYTPHFLSNDGRAYTSNSNSKPGLAFSGGMDSTAALALMPESTIPIFLNRPSKSDSTLYNKSAAEATLAFIKAKKRPVISVTTDVEFIRDPTGFPTDLASGIPAVALASHLNLDAIGYGTVLESAYRVGHEKSRDYEFSSHYRVWGPLFSAAGIPLFLPVSGVSEVGTSKIVRGSSYRGMARSCIRGQWPNPCNKCWKCFRKQLIDDAISGKTMTDKEFISSIKSREVRTKLISKFIPHENVLAWAINAMKRGPILDAFYDRLVGATYDTSHLSSFYKPSIELIPGKYRLHVLEELRKYLPVMDEEVGLNMLQQDFTQHIESESHHKRVAEFKSKLPYSSKRLATLTAPLIVSLPSTEEKFRI